MTVDNGNGWGNDGFALITKTAIRIISFGRGRPPSKIIIKNGLGI